MDRNTFFATFLSRPKKEIAFTAGLLVSFVVANIQLRALITLLTGIWDLKLFHAVILTNIQEGAKIALVVPLAGLADAWLGDCVLLLISAILYAVGLLLWFYTLPKPREIRGLRSLGGLFYMGLILITAGQCGFEKYVGCDSEGRQQNDAVVDHEEQRQGRPATLETSQSENRETIIQDQSKRARFRRCIHKVGSWIVFELKCYWIIFVGLAIVLAVPQRIVPRILSLAIMLFSTAGIFVCKLCYYPFTQPQNSTLVQAFQVFLTAMKKRSYDPNRTYIYYGHANTATELVVIDQDSRLHNGSPEDDNNQVDQKDNVKISELELSASNKKLRFLDRASLYHPPRENAATEIEKQRLFTVKQVEDVRYLFKALRLSTVFLLYGVLTSVGNTFFLDQANTMYMYLNSWKIPVQVIAYGPSVIREVVSRFTRWVMAKHVKEPHKRFYGAVRIGMGLLLSIPCFGIAYLVEVKRLDAAKNGTDITVLWIAPQLILIGAMDGLALEGIKDYYELELPEEVSTSYGSHLAESVVGVGELLSCIWFAGWYWGTKSGGRTGWFGDDINSSHLDRYYLVMALFGVFSCIIYGFVACRRHYRVSQLPSESVPSGSPSGS